MSQRNWKTSSSRRRGRGASGTTGTSAYARSNSGGAGGGGLGRLEESTPPAVATPGGAGGGGSAASVGLDTLMEDLSLMDSVGRAKNKTKTAKNSSPPPPEPEPKQPQARAPTFSSTSTPFGGGKAKRGTSGTKSSGRAYEYSTSAKASSDANDKYDDFDGDQDDNDNDGGDETQSIVTRSTAITGVTAYREAEGPTIYAREQDDMSQITSSLAGNTVGSTAYYFGSAATGGARGGGGRRESGGGNLGPPVTPNWSQKGKKEKTSSRGMSGDDFERSAELAELENGGINPTRSKVAGGSDAKGAASVAQSVGGLEYILSNSSRGGGGGAASGGTSSVKSGMGGKQRGSRSVSDALDEIDVTAYVGAKSSGSVYSRRSHGSHGSHGSFEHINNDDGNRSVSSHRSFGNRSRASSAESQSLPSRYVPPRVAYQTTRFPSLCASIQSHLPGPIAVFLVHILRIAEPWWINARRLCCTLRNTVLPGSPRHHINKKHDPSVQSRGDGTTVSSLSGDDYFSKLMGGHPAEPQQQRFDQALYILRMLVAGALCGVVFLGIERLVLGDRRMPKGPGGMDVDQYGRAMDNFRQRRGVDSVNHIRAGMAHHKGNPDGAGAGGAKIPALDSNLDALNDAAQQANMNDLAVEQKANEASDAIGGGNPGNVPGSNADIAGGEGAGGDAKGGVEYADGMGGKHAWVEIPPQFDTMADVDDVPVHKDDLAYYWHIPRSAGATINDVLGGCLKLTIASDAGGRQGHDQDEMLKEVEFPSQIKYVNVDTSNGPGIDRAKNLGLAQSGMADVLITTLLYDGASVFDPNHRARLFTMFRHPVHRANSLFHFIQDTVWRRQETFDKVLSKITIEEYYKGGMGESNWMTRFLSNEHTSELDEGHLEVAKAIIRRKCLIGLMDEKSDSLARFEAYFGWKLRSEAERECHDKKLNWAWPLKHRHDDVEEGSELWNLIAEHNTYDVLLYEYAEQLYREQGKMFTA